MKFVVLLLALTACSFDRMTRPTPAYDTVTLDPSSVALLAVGDVHAHCGTAYPGYKTAALARAETSALIVLVGDNAGNHGTAAEYECLHNSWGPLKARTRMVMGNHERNLDSSAKAYYDYANGVGVDSGSAGKRGKGYYAFDYGTWRILVLNSEQAQTEQVAWVKADIAAHPVKCQLALFHKFLFTSGTTVKPATVVKQFWRALQAAGADVIVNGHDHTYQRNAKVHWDQSRGIGVRDALGIRQFIVGTGGAYPGRLSATPSPFMENMAVAYGVLKLRLYPEHYEWRFVDIHGMTLDRGEDVCH